MNQGNPWAKAWSTAAKNYERTTAARIKGARHAVLYETELNSYVLKKGDQLVPEFAIMTQAEQTEKNREFHLQFIEDLDKETGQRMAQWLVFDLSPKHRSFLEASPRNAFLLRSIDALKSEVEKLKTGELSHENQNS